MLDLGEELALELAWRYPKEPMEFVGEVSLVGEAPLGGDLRPVCAVARQRLNGRGPEATDAGVLLGCQPDFFPEEAKELPLAEADLGRDVANLDRSPAFGNCQDSGSHDGAGLGSVDQRAEDRSRFF